MNSAELHPNLFTCYCLDFRANVIRAIIEANVTQNEMMLNGLIMPEQFNSWLNTKEEPEPQEIETLIKWLKKKGYEWK